MSDYNIALGRIHFDEIPTWQLTHTTGGPLCLSNQNIGLQWPYTSYNYGV